MQYLLLIYDAEADWVKLSETERQKVYQQYGELIGSLKQSGHFIGGHQLQPIATARTVRARSGRQVVMDGPFAETKEQLGGYFLIEAKDLNEAIAIAGRIPTAQVGSIEVRPVVVK